MHSLTEAAPTSTPAPTNARSGQTAMGISVLISTSFSVLLPVVPVIVEKRGSSGLAGLATTALLATTVVSEFLAPVIMARVSPRALLIAGMLIIAAPCVFYFIPNADLTLILSATALRGVGIGVAGVVCMSVAARNSNPSRRGATMGLYGTAFTLPFFLGPPLGLYLLSVGLGGVAAAISAAAAIAGAVGALRIDDDRTALPRLKLRQLIPHWSVLVVVPTLIAANMTFGAVVSFLPIVYPVGGAVSAATFLLVSGIARVIGRFLSGVLADRLSPEIVVILGAVAVAAGVAPLPFGRLAAIILPAAAIYGLGAGSVQTGGFVTMLKRGAATDVRVITGAWNTAVDIGTGGGGAVFTLIVVSGGLGAVLPALPIVALIAVLASLVLLRPGPSAT